MRDRRRSKSRPIDSVLREYSFHRRLRRWNSGFVGGRGCGAQGRYCSGLGLSFGLGCCAFLGRYHHWSYEGLRSADGAAFREPAWCADMRRTALSRLAGLNMGVDSPAAAGDDKNDSSSRCCPQPSTSRRERVRPGKHARMTWREAETGFHSVFKPLGSGKRGDQAERLFRFTGAGILRKSILIWVTHLKLLHCSNKSLLRSNIPSGAKARLAFSNFAARLKSCPVTKQNYETPSVNTRPLTTDYCFSTIFVHDLTAHPSSCALGIALNGRWIR